MPAEIPSDSVMLVVSATLDIATTALADGELTVATDLLDVVQQLALDLRGGIALEVWPARVHELADQHPESAHRLLALAELAHVELTPAEDRRAWCRDPDEPCEACHAGLECPMPGCEDWDDSEGDEHGPF